MKNGLTLLMCAAIWFGSLFLFGCATDIMRSTPFSTGRYYVGKTASGEVVRFDDKRAVTHEYVAYSDLPAATYNAWPFSMHRPPILTVCWPIFERNDIGWRLRPFAYVNERDSEYLYTAAFFAGTLRSPVDRIDWAFPFYTRAETYDDEKVKSTLMMYGAGITYEKGKRVSYWCHPFYLHTEQAEHPENNTQLSLLGLLGRDQTGNETAYWAVPPLYYGETKHDEDRPDSVYSYEHHILFPFGEFGRSVRADSSLNTYTAVFSPLFWIYDDFKFILPLMTYWDEDSLFTPLFAHFARHDAPEMNTQLALFGLFGRDQTGNETAYWAIPPLYYGETKHDEDRPDSVYSYEHHILFPFGEFGRSVRADSSLNTYTAVFSPLFWIYDDFKFILPLLTYWDDDFFVNPLLYLNKQDVIGLGGLLFGVQDDGKTGWIPPLLFGWDEGNFYSLPYTAVNGFSWYGLPFICSDACPDRGVTDYYLWPLYRFSTVDSPLEGSAEYAYNGLLYGHMDRYPEGDDRYSTLRRYTPLYAQKQEFVKADTVYEESVYGGYIAQRYYDENGKMTRDRNTFLRLWGACSEWSGDHDDEPAITHRESCFAFPFYLGETACRIQPETNGTAVDSARIADAPGADSEEWLSSEYLIFPICKYDETQSSSYFNLFGILFDYENEDCCACGSDSTLRHKNRSLLGLGHCWETCRDAQSGDLKKLEASLLLSGFTLEDGSLSQHDVFPVYDYAQTPDRTDFVFYPLLSYIGSNVSDDGLEETFSSRSLLGLGHCASQTYASADSTLTAFDLSFLGGLLFHYDMTDSGNVITSHFFPVYWFDQKESLWWTLTVLPLFSSFEQSFCTCDDGTVYTASSSYHLLFSLLGTWKSTFNKNAETLSQTVLGPLALFGWVYEADDTYDLWGAPLFYSSRAESGDDSTLIFPLLSGVSHDWVENETKEKTSSCSLLGLGHIAHRIHAVEDSALTASDLYLLGGLFGYDMENAGCDVYHYLFPFYYYSESGETDYHFLSLFYSEGVRKCGESTESWNNSVFGGLYEHTVIEHEGEVKSSDTRFLREVFRRKVNSDGSKNITCFPFISWSRKSEAEENRVNFNFLGTFFEYDEAPDADTLSLFFCISVDL